MELINKLNDSWCWMVDGIYEVEKLQKEWKFEVSPDFMERLARASYELQMVIIEEGDKLRGFNYPKFVRIGTLKEILDIIIEMKSWLVGVFSLTKWSFVKKGIDNVKKAEDLIRTVTEEEVKKIKETWAKERKDKENMKRKEDFEKLNKNWIKIQEKFRALGHPDWMPEEEKKKKTNKGIIGKIRDWWKKCRS